MRLEKRDTNPTLMMKLLTGKIINVVSLHDKKNGRQIVLRLEFEDKSVVLISNSRFGLGFGWIRYEI